MLLLAIGLLILVALDYAALRWGYDSRESLERRDRELCMLYRKDNQDSDSYSHSK